MGISQEKIVTEKIIELCCISSLVGQKQLNLNNMSLHITVLVIFVKLIWTGVAE
jgi:hypothetical protein